MSFQNDSQSSIFLLKPICHLLLKIKQRNVERLCPSLLVKINMKHLPQRKKLQRKFMGLAQRKTAVNRI